MLVERWALLTLLYLSAIFTAKPLSSSVSTINRNPSVYPFFQPYIFSCPHVVVAQTLPVFPHPHPPLFPSLLLPTHPTAPSLAPLCPPPFPPYLHRSAPYFPLPHQAIVAHTLPCSRVHFLLSASLSLSLSPSLSAPDRPDPSQN